MTFSSEFPPRTGVSDFTWRLRGPPYASTPPGSSSADGNSLSGSPFGGSSSDGGSSFDDSHPSEGSAQFLAEASRVLANSLDFDTTLASVARLAVPVFADWATVDMTNEHGGVERLAVAHVDPQKVGSARSLQARFPTDLTAADGIAKVLRSGSSEIVSELTDELLVASINDKELLQIVRSLGPKSSICVALKIRGTVVGAVTLFYAESGRRYLPSDLWVAEELAQRASFAIENALLYRMAKEAKCSAEVTTAECTRLLLSAPAPIAILRGENFVIELANAACLEAWAADGSVIGRPLFEAIPGLRAEGVAALLADVMRNGLARSASEVPVKVVRQGLRETLYFNLVYTPTLNTEDEPNGVGVFAYDVTEQVVARQRATLAAEVGRSFVIKERLEDQLQQCCEALVNLGAAFARIWTYNAAHSVLELKASAGMYTHLDGSHARVPLGAQKIGRIALNRKALVSNAVIGDPQVPEQAWAVREGMVAFAGHPLVVANRLVGVMAVFAKQEISPATSDALASVADQIAIGIERDSAERFRELFIGVLGHDLRNPLNAITMAGHVLQSTPTDPLQQRTLQRIKNSVDRMARMISQVLDFTRARSGGGIPIVRAKADLHAICSQAIDELTLAHPECKLEVKYLGNAHGDWDADRLAQVFSNLIGNAVAYGGKEVPVRVVVDARKSVVKCSVHNMGPPIVLRLLPVLFDPFRRATDAKTSSTQGLGLGLFISKQVIDAHGGGIRVQSTALDGTTFDITLPKRAANYVGSSATRAVTA